MTEVTVGVDVGGTSIKAVRLSGDEVEARERRPTPGDATEMIAVVADLVRQIGAGLDVGVGLAGLVDASAGVYSWGPHLSAIDLPVRALLQEELGVEVVVDNDANMAVVGEAALGVARGRRHTAMVVLGTGIGLGILFDGRVVRGAAHAGEAGHVIMDPDGEPCECGRRGCWETQVSGRRLAEEAELLLGPGSTGGDLVEAARNGDARARGFLERIGEALARGIEMIALVLDPELVVVGGDAAESGDLLLDPVRRRLQETEGAGYRSETHVEASILGSHAGAIGAAVSARSNP